MAACGGFRLEMEREDQAKKVLPIQLFSLALKGLMPTMKKLYKMVTSLRWTLKLALMQMNMMISIVRWEKCQRR